MKLTLLSTLILLSNLLIAQTIGPAGVGNSDGSSGQPRNVLWLRADAGVTETAGTVSAWADQSGNSLDGLQTNAALRPTLITSAALNNRAAVDFGPTETNVHIRIPDNVLLDDGANFTFFVALNSGTSTGARAIFSKRVNQNNNQSYLVWRNGNNITSRMGTSNDVSTGGATNNTNLVVSVTYDGTIADPRNFVATNAGNTSNSGNGPTILPDNTSDLRIGAFDESGGEDRNFAGQIAEVIIYKATLNSAERRIIENYIAEKYGIDLGSNDHFGNLATYDVTYFEDLRGIGTVDGTTKVASSYASGGLAISEQSASFNEVNEFVMFAHNGMAHAETTTEMPADAVNRWARSWYVEKSQGGNVDAGNTNVRFEFDFDEAGLGVPLAPTEYLLFYRDNLLNNFSFVTATISVVGNTVIADVGGSNFKSGYYTLGRGSSRNWFSYLTGDWTDWQTWTKDPSGNLLDNGDNEIPNSLDRVTILSGRNVTLNLDDIEVADMTVNGILTVGNSNGHNFNFIKGNGIIRFNGNTGLDNFPAGNMTAIGAFADPNNGGTVEVRGTGFTLNSNRTYNNLKILLNTVNDIVLLKSDLVVNGELVVERGTFQVNNTDNGTNYNINAFGKVSVLNNGGTQNGRIRVGTGNAQHQLNFYDDFINQGTAYFTNRVAANFTADATDGIVFTNFLSTVKDQEAILSGVTRFYRINIDKSDVTRQLFIEAGAAGNFNLFGPANQGHADNAVVNNTNALALNSGTVRLGVNVIVPQLNAGGNYNINLNARLWIDGGSATKPSGTAIVPYGELRVSDGELIANIGSGVTTRGQGLFTVSGGNVILGAIRTSVFGATNIGGYVQSGGAVTLTGQGGISGDYAVFSLTYPENVFNMSGGTLTINGRPNLGAGALRGSVFINSDPASQNVTGGTVILESNTNTEFRVTSKAPFYNVRMRAATGTAGSIVLIGTTSGTGAAPGTQTLEGQPLKVINDLIIEGHNDNFNNNPLGNFPIVFYPVTSDTNVNDVFVGGSMYIGRNSNYVPLFGGTPDYNSVADQPTHINTTIFNQTIATSPVDSLYWGVTTGTLELGNFILDRTSGNTLRTIARNGNTGAIRFDVNGDATVESGTLDQNAYTFRVWGAITNKDRFGTWFPSGPYPTADGTPSTAQIRFREDPPVIINTTDDAVFGNVRFNVGAANVVELQSNVYFERIEYFNGRIYTKNHTMTVDEIWNWNNSGGGNFFNDNNEATSSILRVPNTGFQANIGVFSDGKSSDGGLRLKITANTLDETLESRLNNTGPITFPVGFTPDGGSTVYIRPVQLKVRDFSDDGYVQVRVVSGELKTSALSGGEILRHYWRITHSDFTDLPTVAIRAYFRNRVDGNIVDLESGNSELANYVPAWVEDGGSYQRYFESDPALDNSDISDVGTNNNSRYITFNGTSSGSEFDQADFAGFTLFNGNFTAGESTRFVGAPTIYYSINTNPQSWTNGNAWSLTRDGSAAGDYPKAGDIAILTRDNGGAGDPVAYGAGVFNISNATGAIETAEVVFDASGSNFISGCPRIIFNVQGGYVAYNSNLGNVRVADTHNGGPTPNTSHGAVIQYNIENTYTGFFPGGDFGSFNNYSNALVIYEWQTGVGTVTLSQDATQYPMLWFQGGNLNNRIMYFPDADVTVNGRANINGSMLIRPNNSATSRTLKFRNFLEIGSGCCNTGYLQFDGNAGANQTVIVEGNLVYNATNPGRIQLVNNSGSNRHRLILKSSISIVGAGILNLGTGDNSVVELEVQGEGQHEFNSTATTQPVLYNLIVNKGNSISNSFSLNSNITLPNIDDTNEQPIEILNGSLIFNNTDLNVTLSNQAAGNFKLPNTDNPLSSSGSGGLILNLGQINITGNNTGFILDGLLRINGGQALFDGGANNFIRYSETGNASIEVNDGLLRVGSQIRRGTASTEGILRYIQTDGDVIVGSNSSATANRGMFEVLNAGSRFEMSGGTLTIARQNTASPSAAAVRIEPANANVSGGLIRFGNAATPINQNDFRLAAFVPLHNLLIEGVNNPTVRLVSSDLTINNQFTIAASNNFDANERNITLFGDFEANGSFVTGGAPANQQTTNFSRLAGTQTISGVGSINFFNLTKNTANTLITENNLIVENNLNLLSGQLNTDDFSVEVKRNATIDGTLLSNLPAGIGGLVMSGGVQQELRRSMSGTGQISTLSINNNSGVVVPSGQGYTFIINDKLVLADGVLDIGGNLMAIASGGIIENASGQTGVDAFNVDRMIKTNSSFTDSGFRRSFNTIGSNTDLVFPIGQADYTPLLLSVSSSSAGDIVLRSANEIHPAIIERDNSPDPEIVDQENVLNYHWIVKSTGVSNMNANAYFYYNPAMIQVTAPYSVVNYIPARLLASSTSWDKAFSNLDFEQANDRIRFEFSSLSDNNISGDYLAGVGVDDSDNPVVGAIPDNVPIYNAISGGNYTSAANWSPANAETPPAAEGVGPLGGVINVPDGVTISLNQNNVRLLRTEIENGGILEVPGTIGHRLGTVTGEGTIRIVSNTSNALLPAGQYEDFFTCSGGGLEYSGTGSYSILSSIPNLRRLILSGSGVRDLPNSDVQICENFEILGDVEIENSFNRAIRVRENIYKSDNAAVNWGAIGRRIILDGVAPQLISGDFTGNNALYNLEFDNPAGATIINSADVARGISANRNIEVSNELSLTHGRITTNADNELILLNGASVVGGSSTAYVNGSMARWSGESGNTFQFPIGNTNRYGNVAISNLQNYSGVNPKKWVANYFNASTLAAGYDPENFNFAPDVADPDAGVSGNEYWRVLHDDAGNASARVRIRWDADSQVEADDATSTGKLRVMRWNVGDDEWKNAGVSAVSAPGVAGTITSNLIPFSEAILTLGALGDSPLPVELLYFKGNFFVERVNLEWETASEKDNDYFEIQRSVDGVEFEILANVKGNGTTYSNKKYTFTDYSPLRSVAFYRLRQVDYDGQFEFSPLIRVENPKGLGLGLYPNPTDRGNINIKVEGLDAKENIKVEIMDIRGILYYSNQTDVETLNSKTISATTALRSGIYLVRVIANGQVISGKLIIK